MFKNSLLIATLWLTFGAINTTHALAFDNLEVLPTNPTVQAPSGYYFEMKPGDSLTDSITIRNQGDTEMSIKTYATDTTINYQGHTVLKEYNADKNDFGTWVTFNEEIENNFDLTAQSEQTIEFTITVPEDTQLGDYKGGIMVEKLNTSDKELQENFVIKTNSRIGLFTKLVVTDNPQPPELLKKITPPPTPWTQIYFYISLGLFIVVIGAFGINALRKKRKHHKK